MCTKIKVSEKWIPNEGQWKILFLALECLTRMAWNGTIYSAELRQALIHIFKEKLINEEVNNNNNLPGVEDN